MIHMEADIINDIFDGQTDLHLMNKYNITSVVELWKIFGHLTTIGVITKQELDKRFPAELFTIEECEKDLRQTVRKKLFGKVEIYDKAELTSSAMEILDISETGMMVMPINTFLYEIREFIIRPKHLEDVNNIHLTAQCRWTKEPKAGFKILDISPSNMRELQKFLKLFASEVL
jgi:hypothetical protein